MSEAPTCREDAENERMELWDRGAHTLGQSDPESNPGVENVLGQKGRRTEKITLTTNLVSAVELCQHDNNFDFSLENHLPEVTNGLLQGSLSSNHHLGLPVTLKTERGDSYPSARTGGGPQSNHGQGSLSVLHSHVVT